VAAGGQRSRGVRALAAAMAERPDVAGITLVVLGVALHREQAQRKE
jgi:hypothetical protein